jgi:hypothetical protein
MTLITFLVLGLATWRIASLLVNEAGPFHVFTKIRKLVGIQHDSDEKILMVPDRFLAGVLSCVWCCSMYVGFFWLIAWLAFPLPAFWVACVFALSALAIVVNKMAS